jgi:hypothetical protein
MSALTNTFTDIADAIREKTGGSETIKPVDMATAIAAIPSGGGSAKIAYREALGSGDGTSTINFSDLNAFFVIFYEDSGANAQQTYTLFDINEMKQTNCTARDGSMDGFTPLMTKNVWYNNLTYTYINPFATSVTHTYTLTSNSISKTLSGGASSTVYRNLKAYIFYIE